LISPKPTGRDLALGVANDEIADGEMISGLVGKDEVLLARRRRGSQEEA
jgi:hypothetical protein